jgi:hypothetical protein
MLDGRCQHVDVQLCVWLNTLARNVNFKKAVESRVTEHMHLCDCGTSGKSRVRITDLL